MTEQMLDSKIKGLPLDLKKEVDDFIDFLMEKHNIKVKESKKPRIFGYAKDSIIIKPDFDEPLFSNTSK